ncbi:hypothetical protein ATN79_48435 [Paraburkholderia caribensis]|nr:hypothetical protein ATN79_48435 [Paraburkholderia caribensis]
MFSVDRNGAVLGTFMGAWLTAMGWKFGSVFAMLAVPSPVAAGGLFLLAAITASHRKGCVTHLKMKTDLQ